MCFRPAEISMNNCPKCGKTNKPIDKVCVECGEPLEMKKTNIENATLQGAGAPPTTIPLVPKKPSAPPKAPGEQ